MKKIMVFGALLLLSLSDMARAKDDYCPVGVNWESVDYLADGDDIGNDWRVIVVVGGQAQKVDLDFDAGGNQIIQIGFNQIFRGKSRTLSLPDILVNITAYATEFDPLMNDYGVGFDTFGPYECGSGKHLVQLLVAVQSIPAWSTAGVGLIRLNMEITL